MYWGRRVWREHDIIHARQTCCTADAQQEESSTDKQLRAKQGEVVSAGVPGIYMAVLAPLVTIETATA